MIICLDVVVGIRCPRSRRLNNSVLFFSVFWIEQEQLDMTGSCFAGLFVCLPRDLEKEEEKEMPNTNRDFRSKYLHFYSLVSRCVLHAVKGKSNRIEKLVRVSTSGHHDGDDNRNNG